MLRLALIALLTVLVACYWPTTAGSFVIDDYVFIAQSRMVNAPWLAFVTNHFYEPVYFRPVGVVLWWIATKLFALDYAAHSAINLVLHTFNVVFLAYFVRIVTERRCAAIAAATMFALLPFSFAATLWPSNRFDLLAVAFLLLAAIACTQFLRKGRPLAWLAAGAMTLLACFSKELAYPIATAMACLCLIVAPCAPLPRRIGLFALLGGTITLAFLWRHAMLPQPYAVASQDVVGSLVTGANAWSRSVPSLFNHATANDSVSHFAIVMLIMVVAFAVVTSIFAATKRSAFSSDRPQSMVTLMIIFGACVIVAASIVTQLPLAHVFAPMLDGSAFGTITFARFYYAPTATFAIVVGLVLARARLVRSLSTIICIACVAIALQTRTLASDFAVWTNIEIRPVSLAAARAAETVASDRSQPCVLVLLDTQKKHSWFRMFSDVTVKALTNEPERVWRCQVLTESTPWIFISPENAPLADLGLPIIPVDTKETAKPDYAWGGVRYRYRLTASELAKLPHARFFEWKNGNFVEVTDAVRTGAREVKSHGWGF
jgi:hypothetical protein